ncbi:MAG: non-homologous end-joining DNA ligase [Candidatus Thermoplasmatota archaeon]|mgnify:CR=1 FL=1
MATEKHPLKVEGRIVDITNPDKVLYPKSGFTKAQVIQFYIGIAPALLPHMRDRPVSMKRYPNGVEEPYFYQKEAPANKPAWMKTHPVPSEARGAPINYLLCNDLPSLVWLANAADLELHTFMHKAPKLERPTMMVFDLDPGAPANVLDCARVALWLRDDLKSLGLKAWPKVSGGKGLQMHVPFNTPGVTYEHTGAIARALAQVLERDHPKQVTSVMRKDLRGGKVFIDWSQNNEHKTTVCVYSLRAQPTPTVAAPLTWQEVEDGADAKDAADLRFSPDQVLARYEEHGDLMEPVLTTKQKVPGGVADAGNPAPAVREVAAKSTKAVKR